MFLLSIYEVNKYFAVEQDIRCQATNFAVKNGAYNSSFGTTWWWTRSPGYSRLSAADVSIGGLVETGGHKVSGDYGGVRPAMWINIIG